MPILATKLFIPSLRSNLVLRARLIERLNEDRRQKLILISAPAGFGKTTLVSTWVATCGQPAAWLSLDEGDNDTTRFLTYLVAALQTLKPDFSEDVLGMLPSSQSQPNEALLTTLLNEMATIADDFILILDDYHLVDSKPIDDALTFLLEHLPPQMHLVITTREDPNLPLARYRVRGQLTEVRAADLRFTPAEAADFFTQVMGLTLTPEEIAALESRTEGWVAGLQMAALSMQGRADIAGFIQAFAGDNRYIVDYLVEEVLHRQPDNVRSFLLQTAILDRLNGPLCDAVIGQAESGRMLEALARANLFVVPLDDKRQWYRYHHLFADVLQARLREERPAQVATLHQRASAWYGQNDLPSAAIRHALAAEDFERAADLVELAWPAMRRGRQEVTLLSWMKALPDELIRTRPVLSVDYAWALLDGNELNAAEARLQDAERWLDTVEPIIVDKSGVAMAARPNDPALAMDLAEVDASAMVVVDDAQFRSLTGSIANARAYRAQALGDVSGTITHARRALDLLPAGDHYERGTTAALLGLAYWTSGELEAAYRTFADGLAVLEMGGGTLSAIGGTSILAHIRVAQGRLHEAANTFAQALRRAAALDEPMPLATADLYRGLSEIYCEWGDLETAAQHLQRSKALGKQAATPGDEYHRRVAEARLEAAQGEVDGALDLLQEAEQIFYTIPIPHVRPIAALMARVWVAQGRFAEAQGWAREHSVSVGDDLSYLREFEHITLARVLIAQSKRDQTTHAIRGAMGLLTRLLEAAAAGERMASVIEIQVLQALGHQAQGDIPSALGALERALTLAEPEGYVRIFVDEGPPMAQLLHEAATRGIMPHYTGKLLAALDPEQQSNADKSLPFITPVLQPLIEPLSQRELDVLRLLQTELSGPEIARELVVALSTVRTHTKRIYGKLNANNRRAAVKRAEELDLI